MRYTISTKHLRISDRTLKNIDNHIKKIDQMLPSLQSDLVELDLVIRENKKRRLNNVRIETFEENHTERFIDIANPKNPDPIYFDGTIKMILPKKPLVVHLKGGTIDEALSLGFERLFRELKTYKGKHFVSDSEYFDHETIRHDSRFEE